ncbi:hypothetical protein [Fibrella forsythiae]|uniref:DUF551 domain-containing protein n=1 Tax=Fibrella forsythiae TaxID=2817061 RepID=A0ABS3JBF1_9BACT|nr:hypothetical protein [Fibrella forsythiae]MBO0947304.1 hypothetical protein [Fibrella forsythiae]
MNNLLVTIPKGRFKTFEAAERVLRRCDGVTDWGEEEGSEWLWFVRMAKAPKKDLTDSVCFLIYDGRVRGYFHIISSTPAQEWIDKGYLMEEKTSTHAVALANWVSLPKEEQVEMRGFQGWRYTSLRP